MKTAEFEVGKVYDLSSDSLTHNRGLHYLGREVELDKRRHVFARQVHAHDYRVFLVPDACVHNTDSSTGLVSVGSVDPDFATFRHSPQPDLDRRCWLGDEFDRIDAYFSARSAHESAL